jgi:hypothetical protein
MSERDLYRFKTCVSFSTLHTSLHFYWFIMSCCVFSRGFLPKFWHSLHISSHSMIFIVSSVILLSFCAFRILEYLLIVLVLLASFCVWTKSLVCKDTVLQGISLFRRISEDSVYKSENIWFPVSRPDDWAIPSKHPSIHCSIRPDDVPYSPDASQTKHHPSGRRVFSVLYPSRRLSSPSRHLSVIDQIQILSKFNLREDCFNRPDDIDSRPEALIHKARIAIQISPSGRQSALVRMRLQLIWKLPIRLQPSGWLPIMVRTHA